MQDSNEKFSLFHLLCVSQYVVTFNLKGFSHVFYHLTEGVWFCL